MGKVYTIFKGNKAGTQLVVVPKGYQGYIATAKVEWEFANGKLTLLLSKQPAAPEPQQPVQSTDNQAQESKDQV